MLRFASSRSWVIGRNRSRSAIFTDGCARRDEDEGPRRVRGNCRNGVPQKGAADCLLDSSKKTTSDLRFDQITLQKASKDKNVVLTCD